MSNISELTEPFYKLTGSEAKHLYKLGVFNAQTYLLMIVRTHGKPGWKWTFRVKDFCKEWEIQRRTFYVAVSKLKALNLIHWETSDRITVWYGSDIAQDVTSMSTNTVNKVAHLTQDTSNIIGINAVNKVAHPVKEHARLLKEVAHPVHVCSHGTSETFVNFESQNTPDFFQMNFRSSSDLNEEEFKTLNKKEEASQGNEFETEGMSTPESLATLVDQSKQTPQPKDPEVDQCSATPYKNENQSHKVEDMALLKWLVEVKIPSLELDEAPRNLEAYARGMLKRDGDSLKAEFDEVLGDRQFQSKCAELTEKVEARAGEWKKAGIPLTVFWDSAGIPAVILDGSAIAANDFLVKPIEPPVVRQIPDAVRVNSENRKSRQSRLRCTDMLGECPGLEFLTECWGDVVLQPQVKALIAKHPEWGVSVDRLQKSLLE